MENQYIIISEPKEVETKIIQRNIQHFGQTQGTPFTRPPFTQTLGYTEVPKGGIQIDKGKGYGLVH